MSSRLDFDDIRLHLSASSFRLATKDDYAGNIRMHAIGKKLSPADDGIPGLATVAFRTTERRKWLPPETISALNGILDDRRLIDNAFFPRLTALREESSAATTVRRALESARGFIFAEFMEQFIGSIAFFLSVATMVAASTGYDGVVAVVEVSVFRIYCDDDQGPEKEQEDSGSVVEGFEKVEPDGADGGGRCTVCFEDLLAGKAAAWRLPCSHVFHEGCISKWLRNESTCPICRSEVAPPAKRRRLD